LFGFVGMLLALPVAAVANVLLRYAELRYTHSRLYAGEQAPVPAGADVPPVQAETAPAPAPEAVEQQSE
jgi:hypothetical protein